MDNTKQPDAYKLSKGGPAPNLGLAELRAAGAAKEKARQDRIDRKVTARARRKASVLSADKGGAK